MTNPIVGFVEEHPYGVAAGVLVGGVVLIILLRGGSSPAPATDSNAALYAAQASVVGSGNQLQADQLLTQAHSNDVNAALAASASHDAAGVAIATIDAHTADDANVLAANVMMNAQDTTAASANLASTLTAQVQEAQIQTAANINNNNNATTLFGSLAALLLGTSGTPSSSPGSTGSGSLTPIVGLSGNLDMTGGATHFDFTSFRNIPTADTPIVTPAQTNTPQGNNTVTFTQGVYPALPGGGGYYIPPAPISTLDYQRAYADAGTALQSLPGPR